jgi:hypothetical protein
MCIATKEELQCRIKLTATVVSFKSLENEKIDATQPPQVLKHYYMQ